MSDVKTVENGSVDKVEIVNVTSIDMYPDSSRLTSRGGVSYLLYSNHHVSPVPLELRKCPRNSRRFPAFPILSMWPLRRPTDWLQLVNQLTPGVSHPLDVAFATPHRLAATCQPTTTANGSRSGGVALLRPSRSALRRSEPGHGHGQAIGAGMHGSAPWKTEETIVGLPRLLVLSVFFRFGGCHLSAPPSSTSSVR
jgi:hypothetical protein